MIAMVSKDIIEQVLRHVEPQVQSISRSVNRDLRAVFAQELRIAIWHGIEKTGESLVDKFDINNFDNAMQYVQTMMPYFIRVALYNSQRYANKYNLVLRYRNTNCQHIKHPSKVISEDLIYKIIKYVPKDFIQLAIVYLEHEGKGLYNADVMKMLGIKNKSTLYRKIRELKGILGGLLIQEIESENEGR